MAVVNFNIIQYSFLTSLIISVAQCQKPAVNVTCGDPGYGLNSFRTPGAYNANFNIGDIVIYSCATPGYDVLTGALSITCVAGPTVGNWSSSAAQCALVNCGDPGNGLFTNRNLTTTTYLSSVTYTCDQTFYEFEPPAGLSDADAVNYTLTTTQITLTCQANKTWSNLPPSCRRKSCGTPPPLSGTSQLFSGTQLGDMAVYSALPGYRISGTTILTCSSDKQWHPLGNPTVQVVMCPAFPLSENAQWTQNTTVTFAAYCNTINPSLVECPFNAPGLAQECINGYVHGSGHEVRQCMDDGTWSGSPLTCQPMTCPSIDQNPMFAVNVQSNYIGSVASYTCGAGYSTPGVWERTCLDNGTWSGSEPVCDPIACVNTSFVPIDNATAKLVLSKNSGHWVQLYSHEHPTTQSVVDVNKATYGQFVEFECANGSRWARGARVWTCQYDGSWDTTDPIVCKLNIPLPGINVDPPDTHQEAENSDFFGRLLFSILAAFFVVVGIIDIIGIIRFANRRVSHVSYLDRILRKTFNPISKTDSYGV